MTSIFTADTSTQGTGGTTNTKTFNTKDNPNMRLFSKSGIYNSADNEIKFFTNNTDALTINNNQKVICNGSLITNLTWGNIDGKPSFFDGTWNSLSGKPTLATVATSGLYNDLSGKPTLATVATSGLYNDLSGKPTNFQADWGSTVLNRPDALLNISNIYTTSNVIQNTQDFINYSKLAGKPSLFDGTWTSLSGKPTNFQSDWNTTVINKPSLFDGTWTSLSGKPTNFQSDWNSTLINRPDPLVNISNIFPTSNVIQNATNLINFNNLTNRPTNFQSDWNSTVINKPTIPDGNYDNLTNKPFINSGTNIYNNNAGNVGIGIQVPTYKLDVRGGNVNNEFAYSTENKTDIYSLFTSKRPWGMYFAEDWSGTTLLDSSGNGRNATTSGTITKTTATGNGSTGLITYISGGTSATVSFPTGSIPSTFTILGLTRYNGGTRRRILQGTGNWLLGHWGGNRGVAFFEGWKTNVSLVGNIDDWLCIIGKNSGTTPNNILVDGSGIGNATGGTGNKDLGINVGGYGSSESSDWCLSCVMIWDSALTDTEMTNLNTMINSYKSGAIPLKYKIKNVLINGDVYLNADLIMENGSILNKTTGKSLVFGTENTERMRIQNDGNVCIGVSSTFRQLHIHNPIAAGNTYLQMTNADTGSGVANGIFFGVNGTTKDFNIANTTSGNDIYFSVSNVEVMRIKKAGNIGIGTNAPNALYKLDVNGGINATSLYVNGTAVSSYWTLSTNLYYNGSVDVSGDYYRNGTILQNHLFNNLGRTHETFQDFNSPTDFGCHFIQNSTNGPLTGSSQYYSMSLGLGSQYYSGSGNGNYRLQIAYNRTGDPYMSMRRMEGGSWQGWQRVYAGRADSLSASAYSVGDVGIGNVAPLNIGSGYFNLHVGRCGGSAYSRGYLTIAQDFNNGSVRQMRMGYNDAFSFTFGDWGGTNANNTYVGHLFCAYNAPANCINIISSGFVYLTYGYSTSDQRIKTNIKTIDNALFKVLNLRGVEYTDIKLGSRHLGLIAQEVEQVIPELVSENDDGIKAVAYGNTAGLFVNAIKELNDIILNLNKRIEALEKLNGLK